MVMDMDHGWLWIWNPQLEPLHIHQRVLGVVWKACGGCAAAPVGARCAERLHGLAFGTLAFSQVGLTNRPF